MVNELHRDIITALEKHSGNGTQHTGNAAYLGNAHFAYHISNPVKRKIAKEFLKENKTLPIKDFIQLLHLLFTSKSYEEKTIAAVFVEYCHEHRKHITTKHLDNWLDHLIGWAEVDSLCQSSFTAEELLADWNTWEKMLVAFSKDKSIQKRRATLVLLIKPISQSADERLSKLAFENIDRLKHEKEILITKAVSWLLRIMIKHHKKEVAAYLKENMDTLPKIAIRETQRKLATGRK